MFKVEPVYISDQKNPGDLFTITVHRELLNEITKLLEATDDPEKWGFVYHQIKLKTGYEG